MSEKELKLEVIGIVCTGCAEDMQTVLEQRDGITSARVNYAEGTVDVVYDPDVIDARGVFAAVSRLGFKTRLPQGGQHPTA